jgi:ubiquinone biosynthesis protein COQ9
MNSPLAEEQRTALIEAILPEIAFDGWSRAALRAAARRTGNPAGEALALFPGGAVDLVAGFSRWADRQMLDRLEAAPVDDLRVSARIALAIGTRLEVLARWREAVRRALAVLALHPPLGLRLAYETVDAMWYAAGDSATDFSFYTKRLTLAGLNAATVLFWLEDRSEDFADTKGFVERRLADMARIGRVRGELANLAERLPDPFRLLRALR